MTPRTPARTDGHLLDLAPTGVGDPGLARWARDGTGNGEVMVFVAAEAAPDVAALVSVLAANGVDASSAAADGRLVVVEPEQFYGRGHAELIDRVSAGGRRPVRSFGGPRAASLVLTREQFVDFEDHLQSAWLRHGMTSVCRYDVQDLEDADALAEAFARHPSGWGEPLLQAHRPRPGRLVLAGEADISNAHVMRAAFAEALRDAGGELVVDCAALRFTAVGAWGAAAATAAQHPGTRVLLTRTSTLTRRMLAMLAFNSFEVVEGRDTE
jgi:anti-anti-sigma regulatory factor